MAELLQNGAVRMRNGRILWGKDIIQIIDLCELNELLVPPPKVVGGFQGFGGGGGRGPKGDAGPAGIQGPPGIISLVQDEGFNLPLQNTLNFIGDSVSVLNDPGNGRLNITIKDLFASTRIVSSDPTQGTDTTIQDAIDNLPGGGDIYVKPGRYVMPAALTSQPAPITIHGAGIDVTILDFGTVAGKFISIDHDAPINLRNLTVYAGGLAGQYLYDVSASYLGTQTITIENVMVGKFGDTTKSIEGGFLGGALANLTNVTILVQATAASYFADSGPAAPGFAFLLCIGVSCMGIGALREKWGGFKNQVTMTAKACFFGCANFGSCGFVFMEGTTFVGGGTTSTLSSQHFSFFIGCGFGDVALVPANDTIISACDSGSIYVGVERIIDIPTGVDGIAITGCSFASWTVETIRNDGTNVTVSGCVGFVTGRIKVTETTNADNNNYWDIDAASTIVGPNTRVNGAKLDAYSAVTTSAFVTMMGPIVNPRGLQGIGTVENKGSNSIDVMELFTDASGTSTTVTRTVAPAGRILLSLDILAGICQPPYVSYEVQVKDTVNGSHGLPELFFTSQGAML